MTGEKEGSDFISTTESISSDHMKNDVDVSVSLDDLFSELAKETKEIKTEKLPRDEFSKIQQTIKNIPKIETSLESDLKQGAAKQVSNRLDITKIDDPITFIKRKEEQDAKTQDAGSKWFNMKQPEITPQIQQDLLVIKHRSALDPKRHYKKEKWEVPKFFHTGTIVESKSDFYSSRMNRKQRGTTLVDEILKDEDSAKYFRRKYSEILEQKKSGGKRYVQKMKQKRQRY